VAAATAASSALGTTRTAVGEIAFSVQHGDNDAPWDIYVVRTDGRWVLRKTTRHDEGDPAWSPDGRRIAFDAGAIYTMSPNGTHRHRLPPGIEPQWSPDGRKIAFFRFRFRKGTARVYRDVYVMNADGTGTKRLARDGDIPRWSPDGKQIAFAGPSNDVYVVNAGGGGERRLTRNGDNAVGAWAPGRKIMFAHDAINGAGPASGIYIISADGTGVRRVVRTSDYDSRSIGGWSPDGKLIVYAAGRGISIWRMSDGSVQRLRWTSDGEMPTWDPSGRQIAFVRSPYVARRGAGIWIVNRDGSGAHRIVAVSGDDAYYSPAWAAQRP
jgi:Tol biopolymer transport system component